MCTCCNMSSGDTAAGVEYQLMVNLTSSCNAACSCNDNQLEPVCGANMVVYFSPCYAGCTRLHSGATYTLASAHILVHSLPSSDCCLTLELVRVITIRYWNRLCAIELGLVPDDGTDCVLLSPCICATLAPC